MGFYGVISFQEGILLRQWMQTLSLWLVGSGQKYGCEKMLNIQEMNSSIYLFLRQHYVCKRAMMS